MLTIRNLAIAATILSGTAHAGTIHTFAMPNGAPTCGIGISRIGAIVGDNPAASSAATSDPFILSKHRFTSPMPAVPSGFVLFTGINASGVVLLADLITFGAFADTTQSYTYANGATTPITFAGATSIQATGINDAGTIVGSYQPSGTTGSLGFIDRQGIVTSLNAGAGETLASGINRSGRIVVGDLANAGSYTGWIYRDAQYSVVAPPGATQTFVAGVNQAGTVSGTVFTGTGQTTEHGFVLKGGAYVMVDVPGAAWTQLGGINDEGVVTGCFGQADGTTLGFFTKP